MNLSTKPFPEDPNTPELSGLPNGRGQITVDVVTTTGQGQPVLLVEVKTRKGLPEDLDELRGYLQAANEVIPFGMLVDLEHIQIFKWNGQNLEGPIQTLESRFVLGTYSDYYEKPYVTKYYLVTLVEAWLRDLGYHWKSSTPPGADQVAAIGLLPRLENADTFTEVTIGGHALS